MSKIVFIGGGKGGVGKSRGNDGNCVDVLLTRGRSVVLVESDDSNPDVYKALNGLVQSVV